MNSRRALTQKGNTNGMAVSVVIPARNAVATLGRQLDSIARQSTSSAFEVIVVDDNSTDSTVHIATSHSLHANSLLRCVSPGKRLWVCGARNLGAKYAKGELLVFCDADDWANENLLEAYLQVFRRTPNAIFAGRVVESGRDLNDASVGDFLDRPGTFRGIPYPHGCNMAIGARTFAFLRGFDERIRPNYFEEVDLSIRAQLAGVPVIFVSGATMYYSIEKGLWKSLRKGVRNGRNSALSLGRLSRQLDFFLSPFNAKGKSHCSQNVSKREVIIKKIKGIPFYFGYALGRLEATLKVAKKHNGNIFC